MFIKSRLYVYRVKTMCKVLNVHRNGFYAWMKEPQSNTEKDNVRLLEQIKASYVQSGGMYSSPRITHELRRSGETCGETVLLS
jgi:putative transposase